MLPETPFLQLVPARARKALEQIRQRIWQPARPLPVEFAGSSAGHIDWKAARKRPRRPVDRPFFWGEPYDQAWFRVAVPAAQRDGTWFLQWKEQGESTAYIGGVPYAGLDVAHHQCRIPKGTREIWVEVMCLESGIWMKIERPAVEPANSTASGRAGCQICCRIRFNAARARAGTSCRSGVSGSMNGWV